MNTKLYRGDIDNRYFYVTNDDKLFIVIGPAFGSSSGPYGVVSIKKFFYNISEFHISPCSPLTLLVVYGVCIERIVEWGKTIDLFDNWYPLDCLTSINEE